MMLTEKKKDREFVDVFDVPVKDPTPGMVVQEKTPVIVLTNTSLREVVERLRKVEDGFALIRITSPIVTNRYVLVNTALDTSGTPVMMSIVSGRYRVLRSSISLEMVRSALEEYHADEISKLGVLASIQKQVSVTVTHPEYPFPLLTYYNSFDRTTRETAVLPGLRSVRYMHTDNGKNKEAMAQLVDLAFNREKMDEWFAILRDIKVNKSTLIRFAKVNMSTTPRALLVKFFEYQEPISDFTDKDFENIMYEQYVRRYGITLYDFVAFIHDVHRTYSAKKKIHRAVMALQAGVSLVDSLVRLHTKK